MKTLIILVMFAVAMHFASRPIFTCMHLAGSLLWQFGAAGYGMVVPWENDR